MSPEPPPSAIPEHQAEPEPDPMLDDLIWLQDTREDRLAQARREA
ncbi:hypothetical protein [Streptomyces cyaneofuscatus]